MYKQIKDGYTGNIMQIVVLMENNTYIPFDPANTDYQQYLAWLAEGNTPQPANTSEAT
jgi:hypothetical protein